MPQTIDFYEAAKELRGKFEIVAFHDASVKTMAEVDAMLTSRDIPNKLWGGKNLPFPVWIDGTDTAHKMLGIRAYPTKVLIDPEGKLVTTDAHLDTVAEKIGSTWREGDWRKAQAEKKAAAAKEAADKKAAAEKGDSKDAPAKDVPAPAKEAPAATGTTASGSIGKKE